MRCADHARVPRGFKMANAGPTLEIGECSEEVDGGEREGEEEEVRAWGRLFPVGTGFTALGKLEIVQHVST